MALLDKYDLLIQQKKLKVEYLIKLRENGLKQQSQQKLLRRIWVLDLEEIFSSEPQRDLSSFTEYLQALPKSLVSQFSTFLADFLYGGSETRIEKWPRNFPDRKAIITRYRQWLKDHPQEIKRFQAALRSVRSFGRAENLIRSLQKALRERIEQPTKEEQVSFREYIEAGNYKKAIELYQKKQSVFRIYVKENLEKIGYLPALEQLTKLQDAGLSDLHYRIAARGILLRHLAAMIKNRKDRDYLIAYAKRGVNQRIVLIVSLQVTDPLIPPEGVQTLDLESNEKKDRLRALARLIHRSEQTQSPYDRLIEVLNTEELNDQTARSEVRRDLLQGIPQALKGLANRDLTGQKVLVRANLNVSIGSGKVKDPVRLEQVKPIAEFLLKKDAVVILIGHNGRFHLDPKKDTRQSLAPVEPVFRNGFPNTPVTFYPQSITDQGLQLSPTDIQGSGIHILENVRFAPDFENSAKDSQERIRFAQGLAALSDGIFIFDAFGDLGSEGASVEDVAKYAKEVYAGPAMVQEFEVLNQVVRGFDALVFGGSKLDKVALLGGLLKDSLSRDGFAIIGSGPSAELNQEKNREFLETLRAGNLERVLTAIDYRDSENTYDIGPQTTALFIQKLESLKPGQTVLLNGTMGFMEHESGRYRQGTKEVWGQLRKLAQRGVRIVVVGGDGSAVSRELGLDQEPNVIFFTGGGVPLKILAGEGLVGLDALRAAASRSEVRAVPNAQFGENIPPYWLLEAAGFKPRQIEEIISRRNLGLFAEILATRKQEDLIHSIVQYLKRNPGQVRKADQFVKTYLPALDQAEIKIHTAFQFFAVLVSSALQTYLQRLPDRRNFLGFLTFALVSPFLKYGSLVPSGFDPPLPPSEDVLEAAARLTKLAGITLSGGPLSRPADDSYDSKLLANGFPSFPEEGQFLRLAQVLGYANQTGRLSPLEKGLGDAVRRSLPFGAGDKQRVEIVYSGLSSALQKETAGKLLGDEIKRSQAEDVLGDLSDSSSALFRSVVTQGVEFARGAFSRLAQTKAGEIRIRPTEPEQRPIQEKIERMEIQSEGEKTSQTEGPNSAPWPEEGSRPPLLKAPQDAYHEILLQRWEDDGGLVNPSRSEVRASLEDEEETLAMRQHRKKTQLREEFVRRLYPEIQQLSQLVRGIPDYFELSLWKNITHGLPTKEGWLWESIDYWATDFERVIQLLTDLESSYATYHNRTDLPYVDIASLSGKVLPAAKADSKAGRFRPEHLEDFVKVRSKLSEIVETLKLIQPIYEKLHREINGTETPDQLDAIHLDLLRRSEVRGGKLERGRLPQQFIDFLDKGFRKFEGLLGIFPTHLGHFVIVRLNPLILDKAEHFGKSGFEFPAFGAPLMEQNPHALVARGVLAVLQKKGLGRMKHRVVGSGNNVAVFGVPEQKPGNPQLAFGQLQAAANKFFLFLSQSTMPSFLMRRFRGVFSLKEEAGMRMEDKPAPYLAIGENEASATAHRRAVVFLPERMRAKSVSELGPAVPRAWEPKSITASSRSGTDVTRASKYSSIARRWRNGNRNFMISSPSEVYQPQIPLSKIPKVFPRSEVRKKKQVEGRGPQAEEKNKLKGVSPRAISIRGVEGLAKGDELSSKSISFKPVVSPGGAIRTYSPVAPGSPFNTFEYRRGERAISQERADPILLHGKRFGLRGDDFISSGQGSELSSRFRGTGFARSFKRDYGNAQRSYQSPSVISSYFLFGLPPSTFHLPPFFFPLRSAGKQVASYKLQAASWKKNLQPEAWDLQLESPRSEVRSDTNEQRQTVEVPKPLRDSTKLRDFTFKDVSTEEKIKAAVSAYDLGTTQPETLQYEKLPGFDARPPLKLVTPRGAVVIKNSGDTLDEARFIISIIRRLAVAGLPLPKLWARRGTDPNETDSYILKIGTQFYMLESFVLGQRVDRLSATPEHFWSIGHMLAEIHSALGKEPPEGKRSAKFVTDILEAQPDIIGLKNVLEAKDPINRSRGDNLFLRVADSLLNQWQILQKRLPVEWYTRLQHYVVHGDLHFLNLLFDEAGNIVAILDWERARMHPRLEEFKNPIMSVDRQRGRTYDLIALVALTASYQHFAKVPLTDEELQMLPEVLRATFLWDFAATFLLQRDKLKNDDFYQRALSTLQALERFVQDFPGTEESAQRFVSLIKQYRASGPRPVRSEVRESKLQATSYRPQVGKKNLQPEAWDLQLESPRSEARLPQNVAQALKELKLANIDLVQIHEWLERHSVFDDIAQASRVDGNHVKSSIEELEGEKPNYLNLRERLGFTQKAVQARIAKIQRYLEAVRSGADAIYVTRGYENRVVPRKTVLIFQTGLKRAAKVLESADLHLANAIESLKQSRSEVRRLIDTRNLSALVGQRVRGADSRDLILTSVEWRVIELFREGLLPLRFFKALLERTSVSLRSELRRDERQGVAELAQRVVSQVLGRAAVAGDLAETGPEHGYLNEILGAASVPVITDKVIPALPQAASKTSVSETTGIINLDEAVLREFARSPRALFFLLLGATRLRPIDEPLFQVVIEKGKGGLLKEDLASALTARGAAYGDELALIPELLDALRTDQAIRFIEVEKGQMVEQVRRSLIQEYKGGVVVWHSDTSVIPQGLEQVPHFSIGRKIQKNDLVALVLAALLTRQLADYFADLGKSSVEAERLKEEIDLFVQRTLPGFKRNEGGIVTLDDLSEFIRFAHQVARYISSHA